MEVAQNGGQAAHVVGVGVGEGDGVEVADAARPERFRDDFLADVEILRGLVRAAAKAAAIDEQGFAVGGDQEQRVALADVDGFHQQRVARDAGWGAGPRQRARPAAERPTPGGAASCQR